MTAKAIERARAAQRRVVAAEAKARPARAERDEAVVEAFQGGMRPPTIARATGLTLSLVRKILRDAGAERANDPEA